MMVLVCWAWLNRICDTTDRPWAMAAIELIAYTYSIHSVFGAQIARIRTNEAQKQCATRPEVATAKLPLRHGRLHTVCVVLYCIFYRWMEQDDFVFAEIDLCILSFDKNKNWQTRQIWLNFRLTILLLQILNWILDSSHSQSCGVCSSLASIEFKFIGCVVWCHHAVPVAPVTPPTRTPANSNGICLTCIQFPRRIIALTNLTRLYYIFPHLAFGHIPWFHPLHTIMISRSIDYILCGAMSLAIIHRIPIENQHLTSPNSHSE